MVIRTMHALFFDGVSKYTIKNFGIQDQETWMDMGLSTTEPKKKKNSNSQIGKKQLHPNL